jgi:hypothetical protein
MRRWWNHEFGGMSNGAAVLWSAFWLVLATTAIVILWCLK